MADAAGKERGGELARLQIDPTYVFRPEKEGGVFEGGVGRGSGSTRENFPVQLASWSLVAGEGILRDKMDCLEGEREEAQARLTARGWQLRFGGIMLAVSRVHLLNGVLLRRVPVELLPQLQVTAESVE